jgi:hypothetical protein
MAKLKAEFLQQYYDANGVPFRSKLIANFSASAKLGSDMPSVYNFFVTNSFTGNLIKRFSGFAVKRSLPTLSPNTLMNWYNKHQGKDISRKETGKYTYSAMSSPIIMMRISGSRLFCCWRN